MKLMKVPAQSVTKHVTKSPSQSTCDVQCDDVPCCYMRHMRFSRFVVYTFPTTPLSTQSVTRAHLPAVTRTHLLQTM
jgi:hypothetical protein